LTTAPSGCWRTEGNAAALIKHIVSEDAELLHRLAQ
jgi:hypothetical protein